VACKRAPYGRSRHSARAVVRRRRKQALSSAHHRSGSDHGANPPSPQGMHFCNATILPHLEHEFIFINGKRVILKAMC
jgi:hypothetical protein